MNWRRLGTTGYDCICQFEQSISSFGKASVQGRQKIVQGIHSASSMPFQPNIDHLAYQLMPSWLNHKLSLRFNRHETGKSLIDFCRYLNNQPSNAQSAIDGPLMSVYAAFLMAG